MEQMETFGKFVATLRKKKGMTQLELADKLGVTDKAVSKWERNLSFPDVAILPELAEILNISLDELMQRRTSGQTGAKSFKGKGMISLALKQMPCAIGVLVVVLSIIKIIDIYSGFCLLGIALICIGAYLLLNNNK